MGFWDRGVRARPCKSTVSSHTSEQRSLAPISVLLAVSAPTTERRSLELEEDEGGPGLALFPACSHPQLSGAAGISSSLLAALGGKQTASPAYQWDGKFCLLGLDCPAGILPVYQLLNTSARHAVPCLLFAGVSLPKSSAWQQWAKAPCLPRAGPLPRSKVHGCKGQLLLFRLPCASSWSASLVSGSPVPREPLSSALPLPRMLLQPSPAFPRLAFHCSLSPHQARQELGRAPGLPCVKD